MVSAAQSPGLPLLGVFRLIAVPLFARTVVPVHEFPYNVSHRGVFSAPCPAPSSLIHLC